MTRSYELPCPVARSLEVIGDRWTLLIVRELLLGRFRFGELAAALPGIPSNLLSDRLRLLEREAIVERAHPRGYCLTAKGRELAPVLGGLAAWGIKHYDQSRSADAVHAKCGGHVRVDAVCDICDERIPPDQTRLVGV